MTENVKRLSKKLADKGFKPSLWDEMANLSSKFKPLNLHQGMPFYNPPKYMLSNLVQSGEKYMLNQYTRSQGHPRLVNILAKHFSDPLNHQINPLTEILITIGAQHALYNIITNYVQPGDEVVLFEPCFPVFMDIVKLAKGTMKFVKLDFHKNDDFLECKFTEENLKNAFTEKTKLVISLFCNISDMKLYNCWLSSSSYRVRCALNYLNLNFEYHSIDLLDEASVSNLKGLRQVPQLELDNGSNLTQSMAIILYLFTLSDNMPKIDTLTAAKSYEIAEIINSSIQPLQSIPKDPNEAREVIFKGFSVIEQLLIKSSYKFIVYGNTINHLKYSGSSSSFYPDIHSH